MKKEVTEVEILEKIDRLNLRKNNQGVTFESIMVNIDKSDSKKVLHWVLELVRNKVLEPVPDEKTKTPNYRLTGMASPQASQEVKKYVEDRKSAPI